VLLNVFGFYSFPRVAEKTAAKTQEIVVVIERRMGAPPS
jgi:hypothetical protein